MNGKSVVLMIIISIISLIVTIASYYGYTRFIKLKYEPLTAEAIRKYDKLDRVNSTKKVIVSLYADTNVKSSILSLLDQTVKADKIIINLPPTLSVSDFLKNNQMHKSELDKNKIVSIHNMANDYGEIGSLITPLLSEQDANTIIIIVDGQVIYGTDFIEEMVQCSVKHPTCLIYTKGFNAKEYIDHNRKINGTNNDVIDTKYGVLVKPSFFKGDIIYEDKYKTLSGLISSCNFACKEKFSYSENFISNQNKNNEDDLKRDINLSRSNLSSFP